MEPIIIVTVLVVLALVWKAKQSGKPISLPSLTNDVAPKSRREEEDDEDVAVIAEAYREQRRSERAKEAIERIKSIDSTTAVAKAKK